MMAHDSSANNHEAHISVLLIIRHGQNDRSSFDHRLVAQTPQKYVFKKIKYTVIVCETCVNRVCIFSWESHFKYMAHTPIAICRPAWVLSTQTRLIWAHAKLLRDKELDSVFYCIQTVQQYGP